MSARQRFRDRVADYLRARPNRWIPHRAFFSVGGECAWRTRISDCRLELGMDVRNIVVYVKRRDVDGAWKTVRRVSYYKFVPEVPVEMTADARGQLRFF